MPPGVMKGPPVSPPNSPPKQWLSPLAVSVQMKDNLRDTGRVAAIFNESKEGNGVTPSGGPECGEEQEQPRMCFPFPVAEFQQGTC